MKYNPPAEVLITVYQLFYTDAEIPYKDISFSKSNQEKEYLHREAYQTLSEDAKEVIRTILSSQKEVLDMILTKKFRHYSKNLLINYFRNYRKWSAKRTQKAFVELRNFADQME